VSDLGQPTCDGILTTINTWDQNLTFTAEKMVENNLIYLSSSILIENGLIEFKTYRKANLETVMNNY
jgi:hypothetical protein